MNTKTGVGIISKRRTDTGIISKHSAGAVTTVLVNMELAPGFITNKEPPLAFLENTKLAQAFIVPVNTDLVRLFSDTYTEPARIS